ncbi:MAG: phosphohistidine phosphatase SixA [Candidatus Omnitrophota bacterium]|nr:MAG: phosphohistidine phosphatase SixA [Candidatus Omnitrophota bacterium]
MKVYLARHGKYLTPDMDLAGSLSEEGMQETKRIAKLLKKKKIKIDVMWHNKKIRAAQSARIFSKVIGEVETVSRDDLGPADPVNKFTKSIQTLNRDLMIVGHNPFLQKLSAQLLGGTIRFDSFCLPNSGIICLEHDQGWKISWSLTPDLVG